MKLLIHDTNEKEKSGEVGWCWGEPIHLYWGQEQKKVRESGGGGRRFITLGF